MPSEWQRWKNIQKCYPFEEKRLAKWKPPYIVQPKYDGIRCRALPTHLQAENGKGNVCLLLSSEENIIHSVPHINLEIQRLGLTDELDGELYTHGEPFEKIESITSRTVNLHEEASRIQFWVFDIVNADPQIKRTLAIESLRGLSSAIQVAPFVLCNDLDEVTRAFDNFIKDGYEGIIVRNIDAFYERKRSTQVMKFKPKKEDSYEIISCQEELDKEGLGKGSLGALVCVSGDGNRFSVGTGFSAEQRQIFWEIKESLPGKIAKVKYQHISSANHVPRFPVFVEIGGKDE